MFDAAVYETLMLALEDGAVAMPDMGPVLFLRAEVSPYLSGLPKDRLVCQNSFKPDHDALKAAGFEMLPPETETFPATALTLILPPRQKDEARGLFARALRDAPEGGILLACLPNTLGAKTNEKILGEIAGDTDSLSKNKCRAFWTVKDSTQINHALMDQWIALDSPQEMESGLWSRPGLFSWNRVDAGSEILADSIPEYIKGHGADFGAGQGFLAREVLSNCPNVEHMRLLEAEHRALACIDKTMAGFENWDAKWADATKDAGERLYDFIVMNPPFHVGRADAASLGQDFIRAASRALKTGGQLWLVANRHLPYEQILGECFKGHEMLEDEGGYKIIRAEKPKRKR
ncbi:MAG: class I SAM-dependent methyltransferase [Alphaproteobacteria bacterium]|nr:16S rRNA methyltransferase [Hyphomonas sp.]MBR9806595.1 class I SAM-dependent methyltransferase [Alphaproteobacteria bacterium]|tara:strand:+ start:369 stop:1409 length:1041 start_codon:yes stop_codon:yes gene_type:complete